MRGRGQTVNSAICQQKQETVTTDSKLRNIFVKCKGHSAHETQMPKCFQNTESAILHNKRSKRVLNVQHGTNDMLINPIHPSWFFFLSFFFFHSLTLNGYVH